MIRAVVGCAAAVQLLWIKSWALVGEGTRRTHPRVGVDTPCDARRLRCGPWTTMCSANIPTGPVSRGTAMRAPRDEEARHATVRWCGDEDEFANTCSAAVPMHSRRRQVAVDSLAPIGRIQRWTTCGARSLDSVYVDVPVDVHHLLVCAECTDARDNGLPFRKKGTRPYGPPSKKK